MYRCSINSASFSAKDWLRVPQQVQPTVVRFALFVALPDGGVAVDQLLVGASVHEHAIVLVGHFPLLLDGGDGLEHLALPVYQKPLDYWLGSLIMSRLADALIVAAPLSGRQYHQRYAAFVVLHLPVAHLLPALQGVLQEVLRGRRVHHYNTSYITDLCWRLITSSQCYSTSIKSQQVVYPAGLTVSDRLSINFFCLVAKRARLRSMLSTHSLTNVCSDVSYLPRSAGFSSFLTYSNVQGQCFFSKSALTLYISFWSKAVRLPFRTSLNSPEQTSAKGCWASVLFLCWSYSTMISLSAWHSSSKPTYEILQNFFTVFTFSLRLRPSLPQQKSLMVPRSTSCLSLEGTVPSSASSFTCWASSSISSRYSTKSRRLLVATCFVRIYSGLELANASRMLRNENFLVRVLPLRVNTSLSSSAVRSRSISLILTLGYSMKYLAARERRYSLELWPRYWRRLVAISSTFLRWSSWQNLARRSFCELLIIMEGWSHIISI